MGKIILSLYVDVIFQYFQCQEEDKQEKDTGISRDYHLQSVDDKIKFKRSYLK